MITLSLKSAKINSYHKKDTFVISFRFVLSRAICTNLCTVHKCTCSVCLILLMVFESACVSSHIQEKEKVAAAVSTISVLLFVVGSQLLSDSSKIKLVSCSGAEP